MARKLKRYAQEALESDEPVIDRRGGIGLVAFATATWPHRQPATLYVMFVDGEIIDQWPSG